MGVGQRLRGAERAAHIQHSMTENPWLVLKDTYSSEWAGSCILYGSADETGCPWTPSTGILGSALSSYAISSYILRYSVG
jgi:hypothetical protein